MSERVAVVAKLLPGSRERATQILAEGAPYGRELAGELVVDPTRSAAFSVWGPLLDGRLLLRRKSFSGVQQVTNFTNFV